MNEQQKKYQVYEDDGDPPHGYTRLSKLETDSIVQVIAYMHKHRGDGVMEWNGHEWIEIMSSDLTPLFFEELRGLMSNGKHLEIQRLMGEAFQAPPPEFMQFMREHFGTTLTAIYNPYTTSIAFSGDLNNLVWVPIPKDEE